MHQSSVFDRFSKSTARSAGHPLAFVAAAGLIVLWLVSGPLQPSSFRPEKQREK